jgi:hypothetical protein
MQPGSSSILGHLSFNLNGYNWSMEKAGWDKNRPIEDYLKENKWREGVGYVLDDPDNAEWAEKFANLIKSAPEQWSPLENCGEPFNFAIDAMKLPPNGSTTPWGHKIYIWQKMRRYLKEIKIHKAGGAVETRIP